MLWHAFALPLQSKKYILTMNFNAAEIMEELAATTQKLAKGYETLRQIEEVQVATTPKELVWQRILSQGYPRRNT